MGFTVSLMFEIVKSVVFASITPSISRSFARTPDNPASRVIDSMKKILFALLSTISISAFATQQALTGTDLMGSGKAHVISDASSGGSGGGQDRRREDLSIQITDSHGPATGAKCTLANDKGNWSTTAPDTVKVLRSAGDLTIVCSKEGDNPLTMVLSAGTTQVQPPHFRFSSDSDDAEDAVTVPYYNATITLNLTTAVAPQASSN